MKTALASLAIVATCLPAAGRAQQPVVTRAENPGTIVVRARLPGSSKPASGVRLDLNPIANLNFPVRVEPESPEKESAYLHILALSSNIAPSGPITPQTVMTPTEAREKLAQEASGSPTVAGGALDVSRTVSSPVLRQNITPQLTNEARQARITGQVEVMVIVGSDGNVAAAVVTKGLGYGLDESALTTIRQWTFAPAMREGSPVPVYAEVLTNFSVGRREPRPPLATTDAVGSATLRGVAPGAYVVSGSMAGFVGAAVVVVNASGTPAEIVLPLSPAASLAGSVHDAGGNPIPNARVVLGVATNLEGRVVFVSGPSVVADNVGAYRFTPLGSGDYYVLAQRGQARGARGAYYPGTAEMEQAKAVPIRAGQDTVGIDITLAR